MSGNFCWCEWIDFNYVILIMRKDIIGEEVNVIEIFSVDIKDMIGFLNVVIVVIVYGCEFRIIDLF